MQHILFPCEWSIPVDGYYWPASAKSHPINHDDIAFDHLTGFSAPDPEGGESVGIKVPRPNPKRPLTSAAALMPPRSTDESPAVPSVQPLSVVGRLGDWSTSGHGLSDDGRDYGDEMPEPIFLNRPTGNDSLVIGAESDAARRSTQTGYGGDDKATARGLDGGMSATVAGANGVNGGGDDDTVVPPLDWKAACLPKLIVLDLIGRSELLDFLNALTLSQLRSAIRAIFDECSIHVGSLARHQRETLHFAHELFRDRARMALEDEWDLGGGD